MKPIDFGNTEIEHETWLSYQILQSISSHLIEGGCELCPAFSPTNTDLLLANHDQQKTSTAIAEQRQAQRDTENAQRWVYTPIVLIEAKWYLWY